MTDVRGENVVMQKSIEVPEARQLSRELCEQLAKWRYEDLPASVVNIVKLFLIDTFGVIGGATNALGIRELNARLGRWENGGSATGLIGQQRLSPPSAALANGTAAHALDYDNKHDVARVHASCVILPTLLATAEDKGRVSGKEFILAMALGSEVHARLGLACYGSLSRGWHPTTVYGSLAGALAAGRMLGLSSDGLGNALGMAYHQASGSAQSIRDGVLSKRLGAGFAARAAVLAAFLASDGLSGTRHTLEGGAGLFALYERGEANVDALMGELGAAWRTLEYSFKPYPSCQANNSVISIGLQCHREGMKPDSIKSIRIGLGQFNWEVVGANYDPDRNEVVHAQFNAAYAFARALVDGEVTLLTYQKPAITAPAITELTARTRTTNDSRIPPSAIEPAHVLLAFKDGTERELSLGTIKGSPFDPLSEDELIAKFRMCLDFGFGASGVAAADRMVEEIFSLETSVDAAKSLVDAFPTTPQDVGVINPLKQAATAGR